LAFEATIPAFTSSNIVISLEASSQSHVAAESLSVSPFWRRAPFGTHDDISCLSIEIYCFCCHRAHSLTRGRACHLSEAFVFVIFTHYVKSFSQHSTHRSTCINIMFVVYIQKQGLCQSWLSSNLAYAVMADWSLGQLQP
jgi:hypothetical protein